MGSEEDKQARIQQQLNERYRERWADELFAMCELHHKTMVALAGGTLALSIAFLQDILETADIRAAALLFFAWLFLVLSLATALIQLLAGIRARQHAIQQMDQGRLKTERAGGIYASMAIKLFFAPFILLVVGVTLIAIFVFLNLERESINGRSANTTFTAACATAGTTSKTFERTTNTREERLGTGYSTSGPSASTAQEGLTINHHLDSILRSTID